MGQFLSTTPATSASGTKAASLPRKRYGRLRRMACFSAVDEASIEVVEWFGRFYRIARPGASCILGCCGQTTAGRLSLALQHQEVQCECKTGDGAFVELVFSLQYRVAEDRLYRAFYSMEDPAAQVTSYVLDRVGDAVSHRSLEDLYLNKHEMVSVVRQGLQGVLHSHGYMLEDCLITVLAPAPSVKEAMSNVLASQRQREAAAEQGEADKLRAVKSAEGSAESKYLQGQGLARFLVAFAAGSREALRVLVTGRIRQEDLAFLDPPPRNETAALEAAGVQDLPLGREEQRAEPADDGRQGQQQQAQQQVQEQAQQAQRKAPMLAGTRPGLSQPLLAADHSAPGLPQLPAHAPHTPSRGTVHVAARAGKSGAAAAGAGQAARAVAGPLGL